MIESYKLSYNDNVLENAYAGSALVCSGDYPTGTYTRTLYQNTTATGDGQFNDCIYNYDLLRITTMPQDPATNKLAAPNPPFYIEPEWLRNNTVHTQTFGFDNAATVNTTGYFLWADSRFSASQDGMSFISTRHGNNFRIGNTRWNTTGTPENGNSATYLNYVWNVMQVDGIVYNGNRELLYSGADAKSAVTLSKSITGNGYSVIQIKCGIQGTDNMDGIYINEISPYKTATRDSLQFPFGGGGNWYNAMAIGNWSNGYKTFTLSAAKAFVKPLTTTAVMTGNTAYNSQLRNSIYAVWGVK